MPEWMLQVGTLLVAGGAVYGGIRADLKALQTKVDQVVSENARAHSRIDDVMQRAYDRRIGVM